MATIEQCRAAVEGLADQLSSAGEHDRQKVAFDRTLSATVPDLGVTFSGRLSDGQLQDITTEPAPPAQIRLTASSDDLVAMTAGELKFAQAWLSGRVRVEASVRDLLKLRALL
jgi:putative sterol carrier protein